MSAIGKLLYRIYYEPKNQKATIRKFGGRKNYLQMLAEEQEMKGYALNNLVINASLNPEGRFKINFLTGEKFIHQTLFCTYSFLRFLRPEETMDFSVNFYSDGTLGEELVLTLKKRFPQIRIIGSEETERDLAEHLPQIAFPFLNRNVERFPLFKKLIYPNLNNEGLSTFFDSDMLFLSRPTDFLNWLYQIDNNTDTAFCIQDVNRSYGYSEKEILNVWPQKIKNDINSGMYTIHSRNFDWVLIEDLVKKFETNYGPHYYLEQLLTAIILERSKTLIVAPKSEYIVFPSIDQIKKQTGTLQHYVNESKEYYFKESWRQLVQ